jgi:hypothetical protein
LPATHADLIAALKRELLFLDRGGYKSIPFLWRPALLLEDSPTCPARDSGGRCVNLPCPWLAFVALKYRGERKPCRHIAVGEHGETVDLLYRTATTEEYEEVFRKWLVATIARLEQRGAAETNRTE